MDDERSVRPQACGLKQNKWEVFCTKSTELYQDLREKHMQNEEQSFDALRDVIEQKLQILGDNDSFVAKFNFNIDETFACWMPAYSLTIMPIVDVIVLD